MAVRMGVTIFTKCYYNLTSLCETRCLSTCLTVNRFHNFRLPFVLKTNSPSKFFNIFFASFVFLKIFFALSDCCKIVIFTHKFEV